MQAKNSINQLNIGDLIFQGLSDEADFANAINQSALNISRLNSHIQIEKINHVALYVGQNQIIDATQRFGVTKRLLSDFLSDANYHVIASIKDKTLINGAIKNAHLYINEPYSHSFYADHDGFYCSELITESFKYDNHKRYFDLHPMNFLDAKTQKILPYWTLHYKKLNLAVPQNEIGSHPQQLLKQQDKFSFVRVYRLID